MAGRTESKKTPIETIYCESARRSVQVVRIRKKDRADNGALSATTGIRLKKAAGLT
jgi:hypothetical protein